MLTTENLLNMYLDFLLYIFVSRNFGRNTKVNSSGFKTLGLKCLHKDQSVFLDYLGNLISAATY